TSSVSGEEKKKGRRLRCYYALRLRSSSLEPLRTLERTQEVMCLQSCSQHWWQIHLYDFLLSTLY
ncbi:unnamed protein product, partial [Musa acuminata var. zebrina]